MSSSVGPPMAALALKRRLRRFTGPFFVISAGQRRADEDIGPYKKHSRIIFYVNRFYTELASRSAPSRRISIFSSSNTVSFLVWMRSR